MIKEEANITAFIILYFQSVILWLSMQGRLPDMVTTQNMLHKETRTERNNNQAWFDYLART